MPPRMHSVATITTAILAALIATAPSSAADPPPVVLEPHRAVYDMVLDATRKSGSISAVRGRMVYEITGSACDGWTQTMRFVTEMSGDDGKSTLTDLRSSTFEDAAFRRFRFSSSQLRDEKGTETTEGEASRATADGEVAVDLVKPARKTQTFPRSVKFPVQHSILMLEAARAGRDTLRADLYDGSDKGEKVYDTKTTISPKSTASVVGKLPAVAGAERLDALPAWPVSISYYELGQDKQDALPVYELSFLFFENGVSRRLLIDYGDFALRGELKEIVFLDAAKCPAK